MHACVCVCVCVCVYGCACVRGFVCVRVIVWSVCVCGLTSLLERASDCVVVHLFVCANAI